MHFTHLVYDLKGEIMNQSKENFGSFQKIIEKNNLIETKSESTSI